MRVLILGGTSEGRALATALHDDGRWVVVSSLAGRVADPVLPPGEVRIGGFGGVDGLAGYLRAELVDVLVDATHPFAVTMSEHAALAAKAAGVPLVGLRRQPWGSRPGDRWTHVPDVAAAARKVACRPAGRVFLTTGRGDLAAFAPDDRHDYLIRTVDPPDGPLPPRHVLLHDRGPYTVAGETALMRANEVTVLVTRNSGGELTSAKLTAARLLAVEVVMIDPPAPPAGVATVGTVAEAVTLLERWART
ncbi:MAG TPA: cobalt-precorrin-6A reductase [Pseudonocardiaceae bacterium]|nr:cobalt-precorrin-6A reductase [Pseudonocardiaceae bacterium]